MLKARYEMQNEGCWLKGARSLTLDEESETLGAG